MNSGKRESKNGILEPGETFEKYTVEKLLGKGGMGAVYLVRHNILDSFFALKVLFPDVAAKNRQFVERFIREAKLACKIKHRNLIAVHDAGQNNENGMYYLIMDYVPGGNVRDLLKIHKKLSPEKAVAVTTQVAEALDEAYCHKMVHRDIKPENIMFTSEGIVKLADLGIAKSANEQDVLLTMEAAVLGTPAYMSPEQAIDSGKVDCRADIYSLGIVLYEMLSGQQPYRGGSAIEILSKIIKEEEVPDISSVCPGISSELAGLVRDMTAKKIAERIATPKQLLSRLKQLTVSGYENMICSGHDSTSSSVTELTLPTLLNTPEVAVSSSGNIDVTMPTMVNVSFQKQEENNFSTESASAENENIQMPEVQDEVGCSGCNTVITLDDCKDKNVVAQTCRGNISTGSVEECISVCKSQKSKALLQSMVYFWKKYHLLLLIFIFAFACMGFVSVMMNFFSKKSQAKTVLSDIVPVKPKAKTVPSIPIADTQTFSAEKENITNVDELRNAKNSETKNNIVLPETGQIESDPLRKHSIILFGSADTDSRLLKDKLQKLTKKTVCFQKIDGYLSYKKQIKSFINKEPICVVLYLVDYFVDYDLSITGFETMISNISDALRDSGVLFVFIIKDNPEIKKKHDFINFVKVYCARRSYHCVNLEDFDKVIPGIIQIKNE